MELPPDDFSYRQTAGGSHRCHHGRCLGGAMGYGTVILDQLAVDDRECRMTDSGAVIGFRQKLKNVK